MKFPKRLKHQGKGKVLATIYKRPDCYRLYWRARGADGKPRSHFKDFPTYAEAKRHGDEQVRARAKESPGVAEAQATARALDGFDVRFAVASGDKETRAKPISAQAEAGNVRLVRGLWNDEFLRVLENFPAAKHDDEVDALSGAHEHLAAGSGAFSVEDIRRLVVPVARPDDWAVTPDWRDTLGPEDF